jgi:hypothetical protein
MEERGEEAPFSVTAPQLMRDKRRKARTLGACGFNNPCIEV